MPPKRPLLQGDDGGDGHSWKVVKAQKAVNVFYGKGFNSTFTLKKEDQTTAPTEQLVLQRIAEHRDAKRKQQDDDEGRGGGKTAKWTRLAAEAAAVTSGAESSMSPSGSKEDRRVQTTFPHLSTPGRPDRDFDAERRSADERREHRRMAEGFGNIQKIVDEGGETQIAAGERRAKGLALRGKVRSSGRFGKHTPTAMYEHVHGPVQYHSSYSEEIPGGGKIPGKMGEQPGQGEERNARCYR